MPVKHHATQHHLNAAETHTEAAKHHQQTVRHQVMSTTTSGRRVHNEI
jgi:hypothetical protein